MIRTCTQMIMKMKLNHSLLYAFIISYHIVVSPSYARLPGALTSLQRYHLVNHPADYLPLPPVDPLTPVLPESYCPNPSGDSPPSTATLPPPSWVSVSPPATSSSTYPTYPTPPSYGSPYTPPTSTTPGSPASYQPSPGLTPPYDFNPSPPTFSFPSPTGFTPAPPLFEPPVVSPPPTAPPSPDHSEPGSKLWCVAKPSVPDPIIQEAMDYACGSGADCEPLQPNGNCFQPDTLVAHASYAFNSYWQRTKASGGTCEFGGSAMTVTVDPSYDGCHFIYF